MIQKGVAGVQLELAADRRVRHTRRPDVAACSLTKHFIASVPSQRGKQMSGLRHD